MTFRSRELMAAIERPLRYVGTTDRKRLQTVKNLSHHVRQLSEEALRTELDERELSIFRSLRQLFSEYESKGEEQKQNVIQQALRLLVPPSSKPGHSVFRPEEHAIVSLKRIRESRKRLSGSVQYLKGVGPVLADKFRKHRIPTIDDLLIFFPIRYEDRTSVSKISELQEGKATTIVGEIQFSGVAYYKGLRRRVFEVVVEERGATLKLKWFQFPMGSMEDRFKKGQRLIVCGKPKRYRNQMEMHHPDVEIFSGGFDSVSFGRIVPVYREIGGMYQKLLRKIMHGAVSNYAAERQCVLPPEVCQRHDLMPPWRALREVHQPGRIPPVDVRTPALRSLAFEELFFYCLSLAFRKRFLVSREGIAFDQATPRFDRFRRNLPFQLTQAQEKVLASIRTDMAKPNPMNRLLQGDVGSGKTILAFLAGLIAIDHGYQVAFMAPTEILAEQHLQTLSGWAKELGIQVEMLLGRQKRAVREKVLQRLQEGKIDFLIGTHALLEGDVEFSSVGFIIVDEQHRFGVRQRAKIRSKGREPDVLVMSATPIPRTLALTLYGDLDVSILNQLPKGRKPIETRIFKERTRERVYDLLRVEAKKGRQAYVVYPLVDVSDRIELKDATTMYEILRKDVFPEFRVGLVHGQMPSDDKESLMNRFMSGEIQILVSTTVIEVGIDVPNATMMVIEHPERFGLSQLHQLRGRVGRGSEKSICCLIEPLKISAQARRRLMTFAEIHDGFLLAEEDLRVRGPGEFFGVAQSGFPYFTVAVFPRDLDLLEAARQEAFQLIEEDERLQTAENKHLWWLMEEVWSDRLALVRVG